jgi:1-acyl-sn-glycerol-3-phosphate acyltransferase
MRYVGVQNVPTTGPAVLAANHVSALDGIVLALAPAEHRRRMTRFLSPTEFFENPWYGWGLRLFGQIELKRGNPQALDEALETIRRGAMTGLFPEGRVGETGELQRGHSGVSRIALATGAPVVPSASGARRPAGRGRASPSAARGGPRSCSRSDRRSRLRATSTTAPTFEHSRSS